MIHPQATFVSALTVLVSFAAPAFSQSDGAALLERFFEMGLPDVKGAKWVQAHQLNSNGEHAGLPGGYNSEYSGNGWLVSESGGVVEVVFVTGRRIKGERRKNEDAPNGKSGLPVVMIENAKLDEDMKKFGALIESPADLFRYGGDGEQRAKSAGAMLLALAQFQRNGHSDFAKKHFPAVLGIAGNSARALDGAISQIANNELEAATMRFVENGDAAACASAVDALAGKFPRGWSSREAALFFAQRLREQKPGAESSEPAAKAAADFLLRLKAADANELMNTGKWLLPNSGGRRGMRMSGPFGGIEELDDEGAGVPMKKSGPAAAFLSKPREALVGLSRLLDDTRFVRFPINRSNQSYHFNSSSDHADKLKMEYDALPRPSQIGEIARTLLIAVAPSNDSDFDLRKWADSVAGKTDDELAWDYLKSSDEPNDGSFSLGLGYLVEKGREDSLQKLREVILDPGVWNSNSIDSMAGFLETWVKRVKPEGDFSAKLIAAAKEGLQRERTARQRYSSGDDDDYAKQQEAQTKAQLSRLEGLFKPARPLSEEIAEIAGMEGNEASSVLQSKRQQFGEMPLAELTEAIFPAALKAKHTAVKMQLIQLLQPRETLDPTKNSQAVREAMTTLLKDDSLSENPWGMSSRIDRIVANQIVMLFSSQADKKKWAEVSGGGPFGAGGSRIGRQWLARSAAEIAAGKPALPFPDPTKADGAALVKMLGELSMEAAAAAFDKKTPDEQKAIIDHLAKSAEWPKSLVEIHFTVAEIADGAKGGIEGFEPAKWKGRRINEAAIAELRALPEKWARDSSKGIMIAAGGPLDGLTITTQKNEGKIGPEQFAQTGISSDGAMPDALCFNVIFSMAARSNVTTGFPIWKDVEKTRAWKEKYAKPDPSAKKEEAKPFSQKLDPNPAKFEQMLADWLLLKPETRGATIISFGVTPISTKDE